MSVIKVLRDLDGLFNYSTDENPTSQQDYQEAVKNWVKTIVSLVDAVMWQPETEYTVGSQLLTPSLPYYVLRCTLAGTSGAAEPDYTDVALGDEITDGTVTWVVDGYLLLSGGTLTGYVNGVTPPSGDNSKKLANTEFIQALASILVPTGVVQAFAGSTIPTGWLLCDGSAVSRTDYAALFAVIGTTYGAGDGTDTFNLPNLVDKFVEGSATAGTEKSAGLPNIRGEVGFRKYYTGGYNSNLIYNFNGSLVQGDDIHTEYTQCSASSVKAYLQKLTIDASRSSAIYSDSVTTVQPPALTMRYIIKY